MVNMIQDVAHKLGHMDVDKVTESLAKCNQRIISPAYKHAYFRPAFNPNQISVFH